MPADIGTRADAGTWPATAAPDDMTKKNKQEPTAEAPGGGGAGARRGLPWRAVSSARLKEAGPR